jgi:hypothetical protein
MWQLALDVGRRALEELSGKDAAKATRKTVKSAAKKSAPKSVAKPAAKAVRKGKGARSSSPRK